MTPHNATSPGVQAQSVQDCARVMLRVIESSAAAGGEVPAEVFTQGDSQMQLAVAFALDVQGCEAAMASCAGALPPPAN
jgi:hypothetical protein